MIKTLRVLAFAVGCLNPAAFAQPGASGAAPGAQGFGGAIDKLFGANQSFSATMETQVQGLTAQGTLVLPGKIAFDSGKSRVEMDMTQITGAGMPPAAAQLKQMGMDRMVIIGRPDRKLTYTIYPGMQAYVANAIQDPDSTAAPDDFKAATTELGKETVDGHPCAKNKVVVTGKNNVPHEFTVWNATDLKKFPVKIEINEQGRDTTLLYKNISFAKTDASAFEPPANYTNYGNQREMMRAVIMKRMSNGAGYPGMTPPPAHK